MRHYRKNMSINVGISWHTYDSSNSKRVKYWPGPYIFPIAILLSDAIPSDATRATARPISLRATTGDSRKTFDIPLDEHPWAPSRTLACATLMSLHFGNFDGHDGFRNNRRGESRVSLCKEGVWSTIERRKLG